DPFAPAVGGAVEAHAPPRLVPQAGNHRPHAAPPPGAAGPSPGGPRLADPPPGEVELVREPSLAAAGGVVGRLAGGPPVFAPAACGCARMIVPSRKCSDQSNSPRASASAWSAAQTRSQIP